MLSERAKKMFAKLELPYEPVAVKFSVTRPKDIPQTEKKLAFCEFMHEAQMGNTFYISVDNDACYGKMAMGMIDKPPVTASGQAGEDFEMYRQASGCRKLYQELPVIQPGAVNYVIFSPVKDCTFHPDLVMCLADLEKADIILRATSYISGDFWESKSSPVISCSWMYAYPVITGKVNYIITGHYHGLKRRKMYPAGLHMIAIPFQKLDEVVTALEEMPWTAIAFREDEESKAELRRRMAHWQEMAAEVGGTVDLKEV